MIAGSVNWLFKANTQKAQDSLSKLKRVSLGVSSAMNRVARLTRGAAKGISKVGSAAGKASSGVSSVAKRMGKLGLVVSAATGAMGGFVATIGGNIRETQRWADSLGIPAKRLEALQRVGRQYGIDAERMADATKDLNERVADAASGAPAMVQAFAAMGLKAEDLIDLRADQQLFKVAGAIQKMKTSGEQSFRAMELMADAGFDLLPLIRDNGEAFEAMAIAAENSDTALKTHERGSLLAANTAFTRMMGTLGDLANKLAAKLAPTFERFFNWVGKNAPKIADKLGDVARSMYTYFKDSAIWVEDVFVDMYNSVLTILEKLEGAFAKYVLDPIENSVLTMNMGGQYGDITNSVENGKRIKEQREKRENASPEGYTRLEAGMAKKILEKGEKIFEKITGMTVEGMKAVEELKTKNKQTNGLMNRNAISWTPQDKKKEESKDIYDTAKAMAKEINPNRITLGGSSQNVQNQQLNEQKEIRKNTAEGVKQSEQVKSILEKIHSSMNPLGGIGTIA